MRADVVVIGAGLVGAAIAYGLASRNVRVLLLDGGDRDLRASTANMGLVWLQGKGMGLPAYQQLTRRSVSLWPQFSAELTEATAPLPRMYIGVSRTTSGRVGSWSRRSFSRTNASSCTTCLRM